MEELFSLNNIAERVKISKNTLRKVIKEKKFKDYYTTGTKMFFSEKQIKKLMEKMKAKK